jgi:CRP-like cAMP-binding protein
MANRFIHKLMSFAALTPDEIAALELATAFSRRIPPRTDLIREGDRPGPVFVVLEGWAFRYKILPNGTRQLMAFLMPGDACDLHIGILAEMDHGIRTATAARVATIGGDQMTELMHNHPGIVQAMYAAQLTDQGILRAWIVSMGRRSSIERLAHLICELYVRARSIGIAEHGEFEIPLSQSIFADALGMTTVHVNRVMQELRLAGALILSRGSVRVVDPIKLVQIAGFDENYLPRRVRQMPA